LLRCPKTVKQNKVIIHKFCCHILSELDVLEFKVYIYIDIYSDDELSHHGLPCGLVPYGKYDFLGPLTGGGSGDCTIGGEGAVPLRCGSDGVTGERDVSLFCGADATCDGAKGE
jgi:hypothetical protein